MDNIVDYRKALLDEIMELPEEVFPNLLQIIHLFKESILLESRKSTINLQLEFAQWDRISDEALVEFEKELEG